MFDPFLGEDEVKTYLKDKKRQQHKQNQAKKAAKSATSGPSWQQGADQGSSWVAPGSSWQQEAAQGSSWVAPGSASSWQQGSSHQQVQRGDPKPSAKYKPSATSTSQGGYGARGRGGRESMDVVDLTQDDPGQDAPKGYLGEIQQYKRMRQQESVLQSQLAMLQEDKVRHDEAIM